MEPPTPASPLKGCVHDGPDHQAMRVDDRPCAWCAPCCACCCNVLLALVDMCSCLVGGRWHLKSDGTWDHSDGFAQTCCGCPNQGDYMQGPCDYSGYCDYFWASCCCDGVEWKGCHIREALCSEADATEQEWCCLINCCKCENCNCNVCDCGCWDEVCGCLDCVKDTVDEVT